jgi:predicted ester cyclase
MKNRFLFLICLLTAAGMIFLVGCTPKYPSAEQKAKIDKYLELWNTGNFTGVENVLCDEYELIKSPGYIPQKGIDALKIYIAKLRTDYPDFKVVIDEMMADKDHVALIWTVTATKTDTADKQAAPIKLTQKGLSFIHFKDNKVKDEWLATDNMSWLKQLGYSIVPPQPVKKTK